MPSIWDILELDGPTTDERAIKSAYAKRLRVVRPDEDQAGFMALRDAFDRARTYARIQAEEINTDRIFEARKSGQQSLDSESTKKAKTDIEANLPINVNTQVFNDEADFSYAETDALGIEETREPTFVDVMRDKIAVIIRSPWTINSRDAWDNLFNSPELEMLDAETKFQQVLLNSLLAMTGFFSDGEVRARQKLKPDIAAYIFNRMDWMNPFNFTGQEQYELRWLGIELGIMLPDEPSDDELYYYDEDDDDGGYNWKIVLVTVVVTGVVIYFSNNFL